ncbi:hypothetical protein HN51_055677 [Arachis hypogaea]
MLYLLYIAHSPTTLNMIWLWNGAYYKKEQTKHGQDYISSLETRPVSKRKGDTVIGGTVNENRVLHIKATRVGSKSTLSHIRILLVVHLNVIF